MKHVEKVTLAWLTDRYPGVRVSTERPADLEAAVPYVQVVGIGGSDVPRAWGGSRLGITVPRVDVDGFASTRSAARDLVQQIYDDFFDELPGQVLEGATVLEVLSFMAPAWTPDENNSIRRFTCSVSLRLKNRTTT